MTLTLKKDVQKHVVTSGNYGLATAGQELFSVVVNGNKSRIVYNVVPGQLVAYTVNSNGVTNTVDDTTLTTADLPSLYVGVGWDSNGNGTTDDIRHIGIEDISGCLPREASVSSPTCGAPQVIDFYFDCTKCDETYSVMVEIDDNRTRSFSPFNKSWSEFVGSVVTNCYSCSDCPVEHNCREVACKLADALNNDFDLKVGTAGYPDWKGHGLPRPFFSTRLHANSYTYCLTPQTTEGACENCTHYSAIASAFVNGVQHDFVGTVNPNDNTQTLRGQLDSIVLQLNEAFATEYGAGAHAGSAYLTGSYTDCCDMQIHVNTCDENFELRDEADAEITPTTEENPFEEYGTYTPDPNCIDCGEASSEVAYTCGVRTIIERVSGDCNCFVDKPLAFYGRRARVNPIGDGFKGKPWRVVEVQPMVLPSGFGSWIQWLELQDEIGGRGRTHSRINDNKGWQNLPDSKSRVRKAVTARCDTDYCSYYLRLLTEKIRIDNEYGTLTIHSNVHIPNGDGTTITAWEALFNKIIELNPSCRTVGGALACNTGADNLVVE